VLILGVLVGVLLVAVVAVAAILVTTGDDESDAAVRDPSGTSSTSASSATSSPVAPSTEVASPTTSGSRVAGIDNMSVVGEWDGRYLCAQGPTAGHLTITAVPGSSSEVQATFRFGPSADNPDVERGAYRLEGTVTDGLLDLDAGDWIRQPDGYVTVDFQAEVSSLQPRSLNGEVIGGGCTTFAFIRQ
jgi:hypothetical protein